MTASRRNNIVGIKILAFILIFAGILGGLGLVIAASAANGMTFGDYIMLSDLAIFLLIWEFNPLLYVLTLVSAFGGVALYAYAARLY